MELKFPKHPFFTKGGAHVPHRKNTAEMQSEIMEKVEQVIIPMSQHIGAPCSCTVKKGDEVYVGTVVGDSEAFVSAPIHSSVSGVVKEIKDIPLTAGRRVQAVIIDSDGLFTLDPEIAPPKVESKEDFIKAVRKSGLVGLGGAGFPAHVKLNVPEGKSIDTLLINCAECEPYITSDHREIMENSWDVMSGIYAVKDILGISRVIIGIESNKPDAIALMTKIADNPTADPEDCVRVLTLKASYPQGAEKVLIKACTGREVPAGGLPSDVGCLVMNVASVAFISRYLKTGIPLVTKRITVDGSAICRPKNVIVPIGTPINKVVEFCNGYKEECKKIIMGGPMMGIAIESDTLPILKQNNAILAFSEKDAKIASESACIRCGRCVDACPMNLVPPVICTAFKKKDTEGLKESDVMTCMECGSCTFVCPAHRHIVQNIRMAKNYLRTEMARQKGADK